MNSLAACSSAGSGGAGAGPELLRASHVIKAVHSVLESEAPLQRTISELSHLQLQLLANAHKLNQRSKPLSFKVSEPTPLSLR